MRRQLALAVLALTLVPAAAQGADTTLDDRALARSGSWSSLSDKKATRRTLSRSRKKDAALRTRTPASNGGSVRVQTGPGRGTASVIVAGKRAATITTAARRRGFKSVSFKGAGTVRIAVTRQGRGVYIDSVTLRGAGGPGTKVPAPGTTPAPPVPAPAPPPPPPVNLGAITQVNVSAAGVAANGSDVENAAVSPDGKHVAFWSRTTNLVPGVTDDAMHLYLKTFATGAIRVLDTSQSGTLSDDLSSAGGARPLAWKPDSTEVLFGSSATNLTAIPVGWQAPYLFAKSIVDDSVGLIVEGATDAAWSPDGSMIAFGSRLDYCFPVYAPCTPKATTDAQLYVLRLADSAVFPVSASAAGAFPTLVPSSSNRPVWSPDSTRVAFVSDSRELVPGDTNSAADVFVKTVVGGALERVSVGPGGVQANGSSDWPAFSPDGTRLAFDSKADNLVPGDTNAGGDDIFVRTLASGAIAAVSVTPAGEFKLFSHRTPKWSPDGTRIAFTSDSVALIDGYVDANSRTDVYVRDLASGRFQAASGKADGSLGNGGSTMWGLDGNSGGWLPDGKSIVFLSRATNFATDGNAFVTDLFRKALG